MGDYKQLNKKLVDDNRVLKQTIAAYRKELGLIRAELLEQHRIRVESERAYRDHALSLVANDFMASVRDIDANINVPEFVYNSSYESLCSSCTYDPSTENDNTSCRHRNTNLVREFHRSRA
ncbi:uncharacterized protein LOC120772958 [Bactrocera tryoni]|uniref:uncharacterized protein LOC120772958 n=1 Tax=Bactrocera tryoni TaxID=59916 RepID=UPI001A95ECD7|nr:uncharacterized protein LOC120772958 [Bactrocera tryoni]